MTGRTLGSYGATVVERLGVAVVPPEVLLDTLVGTTVVSEVDVVPVVLSSGFVVASPASLRSPPVAEVASVPPLPYPQPARAMATHPATNPSFRSSMRHLHFMDCGVPGPAKTGS
jgi:hypothetical protein